MTECVDVRSSVGRQKRRTLDYKSTGTGEVIRVATQSHSDATDSVLQLFAVLAYPHISEKVRRGPFAMALRATVYRVPILNQRKNKHDSAAIRAITPPAYRQKTRALQGVLNKGFKSVTRRLYAGNMAARFYYENLPIPYKTPSASGTAGLVTLGPKSVREALKDVVRVKQEHGIYREADDAAENERKYMWLPSMPVLHLCIVLFGIIHGFPEGTSNEARFFDLVKRPEWLEGALLRAERIRLLLCNSVPEFNPDRALRLLPSEFLPQAAPEN